VGGRIAAEVLLGLLEGDPRSHVNANPRWLPTLPWAHPGKLRMADPFWLARAQHNVAGPRLFPMTRNDILLRQSPVGMDPASRALQRTRPRVGSTGTFQAVVWSVERLRKGRAMSADDYSQKGPPLGEPFPDVRLLDQTGAPVDLHAARRGRPALVVFYRSARW
jgi:hypothetical protein